MKPIVVLLLTVVLASAIAGCVVHTRGRPGRARACPPAHHWDGYGCVHNGHGKHKGKHRGRH